MRTAEVKSLWASGLAAGDGGKEESKVSASGAGEKMADAKPSEGAAGTRGDFPGGFGGAPRREGGAPRGDRERRDRKPRQGARGADEAKEWVPCTKLGRLVKDGKIASLEHIFLFSIPIKESQIVDHFLGKSLQDEVLKIMPVQKQTRAGQRTRFKAFVVVGDSNGHVGLGVKSAKEVATAIRGAIIAAKLEIVPVRRGFWGNKLGNPHTVPCKVTGKCGSVSLRLIPAPRGTGIVAARVPKKLLQMAGYEDCFTSSDGHARTLGNFAFATFHAIAATYGFLTPDLWKETKFSQNPFQLYSEYLAYPKKH
ncbi:40S ribosomal protein S2 [Porphyridium purpureum]|uniref:Small ribosomal subunit protein uS5 n=1 Tax=Porphyridium purpureum TaxID=35688 RepID=A0A5J4Z471_PORPP|nr:40S ribosomal protein S2 [Porphyridium purpureum]|eukprot:POR1181..scf295_1